MWPVTTANVHQPFHRQRVLSGLTTGLSNEFVDMDLKDVISALNQILGKEITSQSTLNAIFSQFCIGK